MTRAPLPSPNAENTAPLRGYFRLPPQTHFIISGADSLRYLNGQVTIDVTRLPELSARSALLLTAKGKICAPVYIWREKDLFLIECEPALSESVHMRLERYIIADDVSIATTDPSPRAFHVVGEPPPPSTLLIHRIGIPGFDCAQPPANLAELSPQAIQTIKIIHGIPSWGLEINEDSLPQEARFETTAVDFDKGCYVGQEVVSRLKSVGRVNQRIHGFSASIPIQAGHSLHPLEAPESIAGQLTSVTPHFDIVKNVALGYLSRQFDELPRFIVRDQNGHLLGEVERREFPIL